MSEQTLNDLKLDSLFIMEDIISAIFETILEVFLTLLRAARRPWRYLLSATYRAQLNATWSSKSKLLFYIFIFYEVLLMILSVLIVMLIIYFFFFMPAPDPTSIEQMKTTFGNLAIEAAKSIRDSHN